MAEGADRRGRGRRLLLIALIAGVAWLAWSRRAPGRVALGNINVDPHRAPTFPPTPARVSPPPVAATVDPEPEELPGVAAPLPDGSAPGPEYTIKGNSGSMLFHLPSSPYYNRTKAGMWFRTPEDARAAGYREWKPKRRATG